jgi:hypothetical protein
MLTHSKNVAPPFKSGTKIIFSSKRPRSLGINDVKKEACCLHVDD